MQLQQSITCLIWLLQPKSVELAKVEFETHNFNNKIAEMKPASELLKNDDPPESQMILKYYSAGVVLEVDKHMQTQGSEEQTCLIFD